MPSLPSRGRHCNQSFDVPTSRFSAFVSETSLTSFTRSLRPKRHQHHAATRKSASEVPNPRPVQMGVFNALLFLRPFNPPLRKTRRRGALRTMAKLETIPTQLPQPPRRLGRLSFCIHLVDCKGTVPLFCKMIPIKVCPTLPNKWLHAARPFLCLTTTRRDGFVY